MSKELIQKNQGNSALKGGNPHRSHAQYHIYFAHPEDRHHVSAQSEAVLRHVMMKSAVHSILITSTVRDAREQAKAMLDNIEKGKNVRYGAAGKGVQNVAKKDLADNKSHDEILKDMINKIDKVGLEHVTKHAAKSGLNTIDISPRYLRTSKDPKSYDRLINGLKNAVRASEISRLGWPEGPKSSGHLFNDEGAIHVEISQSTVYDINEKPGPTMLA